MIKGKLKKNVLTGIVVQAAYFILTIHRPSDILGCFSNPLLPSTLRLVGRVYVILMVLKFCTATGNDFSCFLVF